MVQEMVDRNIIKAEDAARHPDANKIMRALGIAKDVEVELRPEPLVFVAGDVFILCSDGLSDLVSPSEILDIAGSRPAAQAAGQLVDLANARGGHDNITAMVVRMKGSASAGDAATIVKTMPLTAHEPVSASAAAGHPGTGGLPPTPAEQGSGPRGTVLTAPLQPTSSSNVGAAAPAGPATVLAAPVAAAVRAPVDAAVAIPPAPPPPPSERGERSKAPLVAGIVLVLVALGIVAAFVWTQERPIAPRWSSFRSMPRARSTVEDDAGTVAPDITLAPVLAPPSGVKVPWWKDPDAVDAHRRAP